MEVALFIEQIRRKPEIWKGLGNTKNAWKEICQWKWKNFDSMKAEEKRNKCLELQKKWKMLKDEYISLRKESKSNEDSTKKTPPTHHELLHFLDSMIDDQSSPNGVDGPRPAKRKRSDISADRMDCSLSSQTSAVVSQESDDDKLFLLSLVSYLKQVPIRQRLVLRTEIQQLVTKHLQDAAEK